ncbi:uncharacterized protein NPIL_149161 [Nephila pilipes]|uniref:Uncharacterized protein n=1 Tax=Nephila pilipes TaxID=299642 RepID=A0A8X6NDY7_NEPPI|nr:uncharacterized protein NPIL_149161 [Nephila pilipes]
MSLKDILNASTEAVGNSLGEKNSSHFVISLDRNEISDGSYSYREIGLGLFTGGSIYFIVAYLWAYFELSRYSKRLDSWYCICHWMIVSVLNEAYLIPTMLNFLIRILCKNGVMWVTLGRRYGLTLYAYTLVSLAAYSYNIVFKTLFRSPLPREQWYKLLVGLYVISSVPTLYFLCADDFTETPDCGKGYFPFTWQFSHYPGQFNVILLIWYCYVVPQTLMLFFLGSVVIVLVRRNELFVFDEYKRHSLCIGDRKLIAIACWTCFGFSITSSPFIMQEALKAYTNQNLVDTDVASITEIISFCNLYLDPCFVLVLECRHQWMRNRTGDLDSHSAWGGDITGTLWCEPNATESVKGDPEKTLSDSVEMKILSKKEKIKHAKLSLSELYL